MKLDTTRVVGVTLFEDRAEVEREVRVDLPEGLTLLEIGGVSALIDDPSLRVSSDVGSLPAWRVRREILSEVAEVVDLEALQREVWEAEQSLLAVEGDALRLEARMAREKALVEQWAEGMQRVPSGDLEPWEKGWATLTAGIRRYVEEKRQIEVRRLEVSRRLEWLKQRFEYSSRRNQREQTVIEVQVMMVAAGPVHLRVQYVCPCALWRPAHVARLVGKELVLESYGVAWNRTGEFWKDVPLRFSTARPGRAAEPPVLRDDILVLRAKTEMERRSVAVEAREVELKSAGVEGARKVDEMPGVEDGGEPITLEGRGTLHSDGIGGWFQVGQRRLPMVTELCLWPERSAATHLKVTSTAVGGPFWRVRCG